MNRYKVIFQTTDQRVFTVTIKAHYMNDDGFLVRFWVKSGPFGLFRYIVHYIHSDVLVSVTKENL